MKKINFKNELEKALKRKFGVKIEDADVRQIHDAVSSVAMLAIKDDWAASTKKHLDNRRAMYLSMEFLMGRAVHNNLLCLGIAETVDEALKAHGRSLAELEEIEDAALGNGGLGRLAACFLDSAAAHDIPLDGYGIRYKYGLFRQLIIDGFQKEKADNWTKYGDPWSKRHEEDAVEVYYADQKVLAVPYDMPIIGYGTKNIGNLRLWQAEFAGDFDFAAFDSGDYEGAAKEQIAAESISKVLYPNDNTEEGKILRLKQEYFFAAASVMDMLRKHWERHETFDDLAEYVTIQLNDTHPVVAIPELIRILVGEDYSFDEAFEIAHKVFNYTNHTIMQEALEKWDCSLIEKVLPHIYTIILQINEKFYADMYGLGMDKTKIRELAPISGGRVNMAYMAVYVSSYINGVAEIHTEILKNEVLKDWYKLYPDRFRNMTNGITQRRWLALCNPELSLLITTLLDKDESWIKDLDMLKKLKPYGKSDKVLDLFMTIKSQKKKQLAAYIREHEGIDIDPEWIFDIQIKRLHEYKRQLLNALSILFIYFGIKDGSIQDFTPTVFIFGAKAAPGYRRAKAIIKLINEIGEFVNSDPDTKDLMKVVYVGNYNVSYAEKLVCAADVSEQISTAGTEASGTGNMKLMLNGAVTLGTLDGANVEIVEEAGEENNYVFGARADELATIMTDYDPRVILFTDDKIKRVMDKLIDGTFYDGDVPSDREGSFKELYKALTDGASWHVPDHYYVLGDLTSYVDTKLRLNRDYKDRKAFARKCWANMCSAGKFSSDRTVKDYAENIWKLK